MNENFGKTYEGEYGVTSFIPSEYSYLVSIAILLLIIVPMIFIFKEIKKEKNYAK